MIRTIRRKLQFGLILVLTMLLTLSVSGICGLMSYRNVIHELDKQIPHTHQRQDLIDSVGALFEPLQLPLDPAGRVKPLPFEPSYALKQQRDFHTRLIRARKQIDAFLNDQEEMPELGYITGQAPVIKSQVEALERHLVILEQEQLGLLTEESYEATHYRMHTQLSLALGAARKVPLPPRGLDDLLKHARGVYFSTSIIIFAASAVVLLLFLGFIRYGYIWIFAPIYKLHTGAARVAQGDFNYRVKLTTNDEMAELAEAFNKMTSRFQDIKNDLDGQVRERSNQLVRSERLAGIGFLAAGVAHEINNPLSAIMMAADSLEGRLESALAGNDNPDAVVFRQYLQMIQRESDRCRQITGKLLDFSRSQDAARNRTDLSGLVAEVLEMVQHLSKYRGKQIEFRRSAPCYLEVNSPEIKQVLLNLIANGLEAIDVGGKLEIKLVEQTDEVIVSFKDDGCGMTPSVIENIFQPFFTQKQVGQGTGLGLSISHRIIQDHGGTIEAKSDGPGKGSTFSVRLPRKVAAQGVAA